jgi:hypothetical protein
MTDEEIPLPPLPLPSRRNGTYDSAAFRFYTEEQMRVYARAAVLLDRQQRPSVECPMCCAEVVRVAGAYDTPAPSAAPPPAAPTGEEEVTRLVRWLTAPSGKGAK